MAKIPVSITLSAIDKASGPLAAIKTKLAGLSDSILRTQSQMRLNAAPFLGISRMTDALGSKLKSAGTGLTVGLTAPLAAMGGLAIRTAADFESAMNELGARTKASTKDISALNAEARRIGATTQFSASEAAQAMIVLGKAGMSTQQIIKATAATMGLAAAEGLSLEAASETVSDTLNQFGLQAGQAGRVADVLAAAAGASTIGVGDLAQTLKYAAPAGARFGATLEQLAAATAVLGNVGIKGEQAGTALRTLFSDLSANKKAIEVLQKSGVGAKDIFTDRSMKQMRSLPEILGALKKANISDVNMAQIFGKEFAGPVGLLIKNVDQVAKTSTEMGNATGFAADLGKKRMQGFNGAVKELQSSFEELLIGSVDKETTGLLGTVTTITQRLKGLIDSFNALSPATKTTIISIAGVVAIAGPLLFILGGIATGISSLITLTTALGPVFTLLGGGLALFKTGLLAASVGAKAFIVTLATNPLTLWIAGIALAIAAAVQLYQNWDTVSASLGASWDWLSSKWSAFWDGFMSRLTAGKDAVLGVWRSISAAFPSFDLGSLIPGGVNATVGVEAAATGATPRSLVPSVGHGPALGVANTARELVPSRAAKQETEVRVSFDNMPRGVRVKETKNTGVPLDLNLGYSMMGG